MGITEQYELAKKATETGQGVAQEAMAKMDTTNLSALEQIAFWKHLEELAEKNLWQSVDSSRKEVEPPSWHSTGAVLDSTGETARGRLNYNRKKYGL